MTPPSSAGTKKAHRKQILLFGGSVLLPALVLAFFSLRLNRQDNELRKRRAEEARQQKAEEIGRHMADQLAEAERAVLQGLAADPGFIRKSLPTGSVLIFVGRILDGQLQMPWESSGKPVTSARDDRSSALVLQARQAESSTNDPRPALSQLNRALSSAASTSQKSFVRLQIGRILVKSGDKEEALRLFTGLLDQPEELADEYGIPFSLYAADRLAELSGEFDPILAKLEEITADGRRLPPAAGYFARDIIGRLEAQAGHLIPADQIQRLRKSVEARLAEQEKILSLKAYVTGWLSRRNSTRRASEALNWDAHGDVPWLVSVRDGLDGDTKYLFAFHGPEVLSSVINKGGLAGTFPGSCRILTGPGAAGMSPGSAFQGFRLQFDETGTSAWSGSSLPFPILYWSILILVVGFTGFGMYLLWRDVRRELAVADMKSHFAASVSHELKTPLTAIRMFAEALAMGVQSQPEAQHKYLHTIISESERLSRLLNNVLDFSRIEQGTRTYRLESISLEDAVHAAAAAVAFSAAQKGFRLQVETENGLPRVQADKDAMEQAVLNLLDNAMKYSGNNRELRLKLYRKEETVRIDVVDFGVGISEENKTRIFGKFFRVPGAESQKIPGTGLGLTIVSHIAAAHGGRVEVLSRPGEGSTFSIVLPLEPG